MMRWLLADTRRALTLGALMMMGFATSLVGAANAGWMNTYYTAAAQAGAKSWLAFLYGTVDPNAYITVDKPPATLWFMALSVRAFGLSSFAILLPVAIFNMLTVLCLFLLVNRWFGYRGALVTSLVFLSTPVAVLIFRYNNPDSLLVLCEVFLLLCLSMLRTTGKARWAWLLGAALGVAFLTKMLQAFVPIPALFILYLLYGGWSWRLRLLRCLQMFIALLVSAGWWVALVTVVPANARPWVGGTQGNSIWELILGYNGLGRLTGAGVNNAQVQTGGSLTTYAGGPGALRLFMHYTGGQVAWLLPLAVIAGIVGLHLHYRTRHRTGHFFLLANALGALLSMALVFSLMNGIFHEYYTVVMVPVLAILIGALLALITHRRPYRRLFAVAIFGSALLAFVLLEHDTRPTWLPVGIVVAGALAGILLLIDGSWVRWVLVPLTVFALAAGPVYYDLVTLSLAHGGSSPLAGPAPAHFNRGHLTRDEERALYQDSLAMYGRQELHVLGKDCTAYRWPLAIPKAYYASLYQIETGCAVLPLGGYSGMDPLPDLAQFRQLIATHQLHYFVEPSEQEPDTVSPQVLAVINWVRTHYQPVTVNGDKIYDLAG